MWPKLGPQKKVKKLEAQNEELKKTVSSIKLKKNESHLWKIPVCYDVVFGVDLEAVSKEKNLSKTVPVVLMSTRIKEVEKNDTIYQYLTQGQMPTATRVLVKIKIADLTTSISLRSGAYMVNNSPFVPFNGNLLKKRFFLIPLPSQKTILSALMFL